jgi:hypothetical protein
MTGTRKRITRLIPAPRQWNADGISFRVVTRLFGLWGRCLCTALGRRLSHTAGFVSGLRSGHFDKHVINPATRCFSRWLVPTEEVYEIRADRFAGRRRHAQLHEGVVNSRGRPHRNGRIVRYDANTEEFLVMEPTRAIITYFLPKPLSKENRFATNLEYFYDTLNF